MHNKNDEQIKENFTLANNNLFDGESFPKRCSLVEHASIKV